MTVTNNRQINTRPCIEGVDTAELHNTLYNIVQEIVTINNFIGEGGTDTFKVAVNQTDLDDLEYGFLADKFVDASTKDGTHQTVYYEVVESGGQKKLQLFTLAASGSGTDNKKVLVSGTDSTDEYLHASMQDAATYVSGTDMLCGAQVVDNSGNERLRVFVDTSGITDYSATGFHFLTISSNAFGFRTPLLCANQIFGAVTLSELSYASPTLTASNDKVLCSSNDTTKNYLHSKLTTAATRNTNADPVIAAETANDGSNETETLFLDASAISGYSASGTWALCEVNGVATWVELAEWIKDFPNYNGAVDQILGHSAGGNPEWKTVVSDVINHPTGISLALINGNTELEVKLSYTPVTFKTWPATSDGDPDDLAATEEAVECP